VTIVGSGTCTIDANQAGNANYNAAPQVSQGFSTTKTNQTITFPAIANKVFGNAPFGISATATSGLTVVFTSASSSVCTVSGTTVSIVAAGICTINANQAGDANYNAAAQVSQSFTVSKASQTITFAPLGNKTLGDPPFTVTASASSGLAVAFSSLTTASARFPARR
jgi:hypothetical protein